MDEFLHANYSLFCEAKTEGNMALKNEKYLEAIEYYDQALNYCIVASQLIPGLNISTELSIIYSNMSHAYLKIKNPEAAKSFAFQCIQHKPSWWKGYWRIASAFQATNCKHEELYYLSEGLPHILEDETKCELIRTNFVLSIVKSSYELKARDYQSCKVSKNVWSNVVFKLSLHNDHDNWKVIHLLLLGGGNKHRENSGGMATNCDMSKINYKYLISENDKAILRQWGVSLIIELIKYGADIKWLCLDESSTPLHSALQLCVIAGKVDLLKLLFDNNIKSPEDRSLVNSKGQTLLHILSNEVNLNSTQTQFTETVARLLINYHVNLLLKDFEGNLAIDLIPSTCQIYPLIQHAMDKNIRDHKKLLEGSSYKPKKADELIKGESLKIQFGKRQDDKESLTEKPNSSSLEKNQQLQSLKKPLTSQYNGSKNSKKKGKSKHKSKRERQKRPQIKVDFKQAKEPKIETLIQKGLTDLNFSKFESALDYFLLYINENFENDFNNDDIEECIYNIVTVLRHLEELKATCQCEAPPDIWKNSILRLASNNEWLIVYKMLCGGGNGFGTGSGGLASGSDLSSLSLIHFLTWTATTQHKTLNTYFMFKALLENNVDPNGLTDDEVKPIVYCIRNDFYKFLGLLLKHGADISLLSIKDGDTPFHAALQLGLKNRDRSLDLLKMIFQKCSQDSKDYSQFTPNALDSEGNSLFHLALVNHKDDDPLSLEAVRILAEYRINPYLNNKKGDTPFDILKKNDRRLQYLKVAAKHHQMPKTKQENNFTHDIKAVMEVDFSVKSCNLPHENVKKKETRLHESEVKYTRIEMRQQIQCLINQIPQIIPKRLQEEETEANFVTIPKIQGIISSKTVHQTSQSNFEKPLVDTIITQQPDGDGNGISNNFEKNEDDANMFDDCLWEVECTSKVWRILHDNKTLNKRIKYQIVKKLQTLAKGDWRPELHKSMSVTTKGNNIKLFEAKLDRASRILWELAIVFSPTQSEMPEKRLQDDPSEKFQVPGGRLYSEIIRVWDIVFDHDNVQKAVDNILKSHNKGQTCIIQKKLKGIERKHFSSGKTSELKVPMIYSELDDIKFEKPPQLFFPPASSQETEYHIMKFYSFSSALVNNILYSDNETTVDFPFRVTELEHAIINLKPKPPSSILLLGRSGTGKTTCCVYRLWTSFIRYWEKAVRAGQSIDEPTVPLIPRNICYESQVSNSEFEDNELDNEEEIDETIQFTNNSQQYPQRFEKLLSKKRKKKLLSKKWKRDGNNPQTTETNESTQLNDEKNDNIFEHLHQIFITKNAVLCNEVKKSFCNLSHGVQAAKYHTEVENLTLPHRLQDVHPDAFPFFLSAREWLLLLDGSLPDPFFPRNEDGSLQRPIRGWNRDGTHIPFVPIIDDDDDDDEDDDIDDNIENEDDIRIFRGDYLEREHEKNYDPRKEVTYEIFAHNLWPKVNKNEVEYHPTLVWMEIISFIKGSVEALHTKDGYVSEEQYLDLGRRRAPNFTADRKRIYDLFKKYQNIKRQASYFDEADLVFNIYNRLKKIDHLDWSIHQFYVDEIQDFTQAELALIIHCSRDPNGLFLTGDTAQSIMRGIAFRFADLKSLFYFAHENMKAIGKTSSVSVPKKVYQLCHNYRSHTGIVNLATSVLDILTCFFPDSFDQIKKEQGLFEGPKPVLLESCSFSDLAVLLKGSRRKTSEIEFGAHQVILVANEETKSTLPPELNLGLVLSIYEAKGLEFDDVLLYNFFKDSPARQEWRLVTSYLHKLIEGKESKKTTTKENESYFELDINEKILTTRPLEFCPDKHKVLNSELKYLYTALTRARVNVWIFDEDEEKRSPMFEYFQATQLVQVVKPIKDEVGRETLSDGIFTNKSSPEEWNKRGDYFSSHKLWQVAAKCYGKGGDVMKEKIALAYHRALEAQQHIVGNKNHNEFLKAAREFLECKLYHQAARCLYNSKEFYLSAQLFEKQGMFKQAVTIYKKLRKLEDASRIFEQVGDFRAAVDFLYNMEAYDKALDVMDRYDLMEKDYIIKGKDSRPLFEKKPRHSIENLCLLAAKSHYDCGNIESMLNSLSRVPSLDVQVSFLIEHNKIIEAAEILKNGLKQQDAAKLLREHGYLHEALNYNTDPKFRAECLLAYSRHKIPSIGQDTNFDEIIDNLNEAVKYFNDPNKKAEAKMWIGFLKKDCKIIREAEIIFFKEQNFAGGIECMDQRLSIGTICLSKHNTLEDNFLSVGEILPRMENLLRLANILISPSQNTKHLVTLCDTFFGLTQNSDGSFNASINEGARIISLNHSMTLNIKPIEAHKEIMQKLLKTANRWTEDIQSFLSDQRIKLKQCPVFIIGKSCYNDKCQHLHEAYNRYNYFQYILSIALEIQLNHILKESLTKILKNHEDYITLIKEMNGFAMVLSQNYELCSTLYGALLPSHLHLRVLSQNNQAAKQVLGYLQDNKHVCHQLEQWSNYQFKGPSTSLLDRVSGTDLFFSEYILHLLIFGNANKLKSWIEKVENEFTRFVESKNIMKIHPKYGIIPHKFGTKLKYISFFTRFFDSADQLHTKQNIFECQSSFNQFFGIPVSRAPLYPIMPSIETTLIMLEHQYTICLATYARLTKIPIVLPASYLAQINFFDYLICNQQKQHSRTYYSIQKYGESHPEKFNKLIGQISFMVKVMCGEKNSSFDILADVFNPENVQYIDNGTAERSLVLTLIMLSNVGRATLPEYEASLRQQIHYIEKTENMPKRLSSAIESVKKACGVRSVVKALNYLLLEREDEKLHEYFWRWDNNFKGLYYTPLQYDHFLVNFFTNFVPILPDNTLLWQEHKAKTSNPIPLGHEISEFIQEEITKEEEQRLFQEMIERRGKERAAFTIWRHYKAYKSLKIKESEKFETQPIYCQPNDQMQSKQNEYLNEKFSIIPTYCNICNIMLKETNEKLNVIEGSSKFGHNEDLDEDTPMINITDLGLVHSGSIDNNELPTYTVHIQSSKHCENLQKVPHFKSVYLQSSKVLQESNILTKKLKERASEFTFGLNKLETNIEKLRSFRDEVLREKYWDKLSLLTTEAERLSILVINTEKEFRQKVLQSDDQVEKPQANSKEDEEVRLIAEGMAETDDFITAMLKFDMPETNKKHKRKRNKKK